MNDLNIPRLAHALINLRDEEAGYYTPLAQSRRKDNDSYLIYDLDSKGWIRTIKLHDKRTRVRIRAYRFSNEKSAQRYIIRHKKAKRNFLEPEKFLFPTISRPMGCGRLPGISPKLWEETRINNTLKFVIG